MAFLKKSLIFVHRWLGVVLCLFFLQWFVSGIVMMYWDFPSVSQKDQIARSPELNPADIRISPADGYARLKLDEPVREVRLSTFAGRPVYRFEVGRGEARIYADNGQDASDVSPQIIQRNAAGWSGRPTAEARVESLNDVDQWTVQASASDFPISKFSWPDGQQVYVSESTGDVVQYTTTRSRFWAYLGAIPHWLYLTPLRRHPKEWNSLVIWTSGIGTIAAILGIAVGLWMFSPSRRYRYAGFPSSVPYRGPKRWHMIAGLIAGLAAVTWAFSGFLSMDPITLPGAGAPRLNIQSGLRDKLRLTDFDATSPQQALRQISGFRAKELRLVSVSGEPTYLAIADRGETRVIPVQGMPFPGFDEQQIMDRVREIVRRSGSTADIRMMNEYDAYYLSRNHDRPLPVIFIKVNDQQNSRYYVDPKTARLVGAYGSSQWVTRWLYHGLHSLELPWLYERRPLWDIVVISCMLAGTILSATSVWLVWRMLRRKISSLFNQDEIRYANP